MIIPVGTPFMTQQLMLVEKTVKNPHHQPDARTICSFQKKSMNRFFSYQHRLVTATAILSVALIPARWP